MTGGIVYGARNTSPHLLAREIESLLGCAFEMRESDYWGGDYFNADLDSRRSVRVLNNTAPDEDDIPYLEYKDHPVIVDASYASEETVAALGSIEGLVLLERHDVP